MNTPDVTRFVRLAAVVVAPALLALTAVPSIHAQGCVAVRQMGDVACTVGAFQPSHGGRWSINVNYEWFESHRHFVGREEQHHRAEEGTEVINDTHQVTTRLAYALSPRTTLTLDVPYFRSVRSSLYEHDRINRHSTSSSGLGDIVIGSEFWVKAPAGDARSNLALGFGLKLPTGDSNAKDTFRTVNGPVVRNVDQSIQPGDGGWGIALSAQAFKRIGDSMSLYGSLYYLVSPQETSGTFRSTDPIVGRFSITDQYQARGGVAQVVSARHGIAASLGGLIEGIPSSDIVGGDRGFRRPGYTISIEPGLTYMTGAHTFTLSVPVAVDRNRVRSFADKINGRHGDAAFADYAINCGYGYRW